MKLSTEIEILLEQNAEEKSYVCSVWGFYVLPLYDSLLEKHV